MSEHAWFQENLAAHLAGGLSPLEAERLQQHAAACPDCATALSQALHMDRDLEALFAGACPGPALEDRMIHALRTASRHMPKRWGVYVRCALGAAAVLLLGAAGTILTGRVASGDMGFPWETWGRQELLARADLEHFRQSGIPVEGVNFDEIRRSTILALKDANELATDGFEMLPTVQKAPGNTPLGVDFDDSRKKDEKSQHAFGTFGPDGNYYDPSRSLSIKGTSRIHTNAPYPSVLNYSYRNDQSSSTATAKSPPPAATVLDFAPASGGGSATGSTAQVSSQPVKADLFGYFKPAEPVASSLDRNKSGPNGAGKDSGKESADPKEIKVKVALQDPQKKLGEETLALEDKEKKPAAETPAAVAQKPAAPPAPALPAAPAATRKIIRSGDMEFEVQSFDTAVASIIRLIGDTSGGFVATVNSEKLPNGKVKGSVVVRVPPERLDGFLLDLRKELGKAGELKGQRIGSQDITKQFTDLESRLRAARAMEERLLQIIKTGKGEIKDLLLAEKELGIWRTRIEEQEGELRYFANQIALSTMNIILVEREIRAAIDVVATERVQMGLEVENVEKAQREALAAVAAAKGRITRSELKQHGAGQFNAILNFEVAPDAAGPIRDRLKQLGELARLEVDRLMQNEGGTGRPTDDKVRRSDTVFQVSLYNLTNVAPRQSIQISLACVDVESTYQVIAALARKETGRVVASLNRQHADQTTGSVSLEVPAADADATLRTIKEAGEVLRLQTSDNPDQQNSTRSKRGFVVQLVALSMVEPRETETLKLAARDVPAEFRSLQEAVAKAKGRVLRAQFNEQDRQNIVADLDFDVRRSEEAGIRTALAASGAVYSRSVTRAPESDNKTDSKVRMQVQIVNVANLKSRETVVLGVEVPDVDRAAAQLAAFADQAKGRTVESHQTRERNGRVITRVVFEVPLTAAPALVGQVKDAGTLRTQQSSRDPQAPEGELATARLDVTLSNTDLIVPSDQGLWTRVRQGLSTSFLALSWSLTVVIVGLFFVLPWIVALYIFYRVTLRLRRRQGAPSGV